MKERMDLQAHSANFCETDLQGIQGDCLRALFNNFPDLVWLKNLDRQLVGCNRRFEHWLGQDKQALLGKTEAAFLNPEIAELFEAHENRVLQGADASVHEVSVVFARDGHEALLEVTHAPVRDSRGELIGILGVGHDMTDRKQAEDELKQAASVFEHANEGIMITDPNGTILDVNAAFSGITGYERAEVLGQTPRMLKSGRQDAEHYQQMWHALKTKGHWTGEVWNRRKDGEIYAELQTISAVRDDQGKVLRYVAIFSDITSIKEHQKQLERIAHYDLLTGLPNRMLLADRMKQAMAHARRSGEVLAVCLMDLDGFKPVNDSLGHKAGDAVLQEIAYRMNSSIRGEDTAARLGGDEFALLLGGFKSASQCEMILRRLLESVSQPIGWEGQSIRVTGSLGVAFYQGNDADADQLLRHADQAMYQAKEKGKNRYHLFDTAVDLRLRANQGLFRRIEKAFEQGQFCLYYQPQIDCHQGRIVGVEALIRWNHPTLGIRGPSEFIPLIEHDDLIIRLGDWVIAEALRQMAEWRDAGLNLSVSVNVTVRQFVHGGFGHRLKSLLAPYPADLARQLQIELVETAALEDVSAVSTVISEQREQGIRFALDDFGTGYSSLVHLKRLAVDELKIDQTFVRDILMDAGDMAIAQGVIGLAAAFGYRVVAEGVETTEHVLMLLELGCHVMQGYGLARPMPARNVLAWCQHFHTDPRWRIASNRYPSRDNFELLLMEVAHRHWLEAWLDEKQDLDQLPAIEMEQSRFGQWCRDQGLRRYDGVALVHEADRLHHEVFRRVALVQTAYRTHSESGLADARMELAQASRAFLDCLQSLRASLVHQPPKTLE